MAYQIYQDRCLGCGACAYACLYEVPLAVDFEKTKYAIDAQKCLGCGQCVSVCPNDAIHPAPGHRTIKRVSIKKGNCIGCSLCARACPAGAPHGEIKSPFEIDESKCFRCGYCATKCKKDAIVVEYE